MNEEEKQARWRHWQDFFLKHDPNRELRESIEALAHKAVEDSKADYDRWLKENGYKRDENGKVIPKRSGKEPVVA